MVDRPHFHLKLRFLLIGPLKVLICSTTDLGILTVSGQLKLTVSDSSGLAQISPTEEDKQNLPDLPPRKSGFPVEF